MKKILTLFTALVLLGSMAVVQADYYVAGTMNGWNAGSNDWKMSGSNPSSFTKQMASGTYQFKVTNGSWDWSTDSFDNSLSNVTLSSQGDNIQFTLSEESNVTFYYNGSNVYVQAVEVVVPSYTFTAGTTIYYDFTAYSTTGIDTYVGGNAAWYGSTDNVIAITLSSDWKVTASTKLWRCGAGGSWNDYYCTSLPTAGQDMIISTDGINYIWDTYGGGVLPPASIKLHSNITNPSWADTEEFTLAADEETATLTLNNVAVGNYNFGVKIAESWTSNGASFTRANPSGVVESGSGNCSFLADIAGDYTFTWTYESKTLAITYPDMVTKEVKFFAPRTEDNPWDNVYAFVWNGNVVYSADWPGDEITSTKSNGWYTYNVPVGASIIFNDGAGMQTNDITNVTVAACYEPTSIYNPEDPAEAKKVTVTANANCEVAYYIAGSKELIGGEDNFDTNVALDGNNQVVFQDVEPGTYSFKINNGTWAWALGGNSHLKSGDCQAIAQTVGVGDVGFKIDTKQDVTITYDPENQEICLGAVTVKADGELSVDDMTMEAGESRTIGYWTNNTEATGATFVVLSGVDKISLNDGVVLGVKAGQATIRVSIAETANYTAVSEEFTVTVTSPSIPAIDPIAPIGGKFTINANGDTAIFARGNLQYQQSSSTWRCAPNQYEWKGTGNLQMGNPDYEGWVDLFCWSIGDDNNYGATSSYLTTTYFNKNFVDWGGLFPGGEWSTLSINEWYYLLYTRANANNLWGMAMIDDNLGMILLPDQWTAPSGVTFVPGTIPTTNLFDNADCLDPTLADQDHWRLNPNNLPANKFTVSEWGILEAAGAVFLPYGGRRSGGYGNHINRQDQTIAGEYAYSYYENYYGSYWTSTVRYPEQGKAYWLPLICGGCNDQTENWGRGSHGWWENGRYGHSVRLVKRIPNAWTEVRTGLEVNRHYTVCLEKNITAIDGATFWNMTYKDAEPATMVYLVEETAPEAGKPYIFQATKSTLKVICGDETAYAPVDNGALRGTFEYMSKADLEAKGNVYLLIQNAIRPITDGNYLDAHRAYVDYDALVVAPSPNFAPGKNVKSMPMQPKVATGMENGELINGENGVQKVLINGQLFILRGDKMYDVTGRLVK